MSVIKFIKSVELKYDVASIKIGDVQLWPILRIAYFYAYINKNITNINEPIWSLSSKKIKRIKNIYYGFLNLFRKYSYFILTYGARYMGNSGIFSYNFTGGLLELLPLSEVLLLEDPGNVKHPKKKFINNSHIISLDIFLLIAKLIPIPKLKIENEYILTEIEQEYELPINYRRIVKTFFQFIKMTEFMVSKFLPKWIFIDQYYHPFYMAMIYSSHKIGCRVVEFQHGTIAPLHPAYNLFTDLDRKFYPDYLFAFGDYVKGMMGGENKFMDKEDVYIIGNGYIDYINDSQITGKIIRRFESYRKKYKRIVAVSAQVPIERQLIKFLIDSADLDKDILYLFVPRDKKRDYRQVNFPSNILVIKDLNVYQVIKESDFHATVSSTCALEALAIGVPNILINILNEARNMYGYLLNGKRFSLFADTPEEFIHAVNEFKFEKRKNIQKVGDLFYRPGYLNNLKEALLNLKIIRHQNCN